MDYITSRSGQQFDPTVVDALQSLRADFASVASRLRD
jgi:response regulator RpfG family c-di-GMP phosphodiesterase